MSLFPFSIPKTERPNVPSVMFSEYLSSSYSSSMIPKNRVFGTLVFNEFENVNEIVSSIPYIVLDMFYHVPSDYLTFSLELLAGNMVKFFALSLK